MDDLGVKITAVIICVVLIIGMIVFFASTTVVPTGHIGVVTLYQNVQDKYLDAGFHMIKPFVEDVHDVDIRTQKYSNTVEGSAKDLQIVNITMSINYQIKPEKVTVLEMRSHIAWYLKGMPQSKEIKKLPHIKVRQKFYKRIPKFYFKTIL